MTFRLILSTVPILLAACMTDPLSTKPETNAQLPEADSPMEDVNSESPDQALPELTESEEPEGVGPADPVSEIGDEGVPSDDVPFVAPFTAGAEAAFVDHTSTDPVPFTDKLVRGLRNDASVTLKAGQTLTIALNANRSFGYVWQLDGPFEEGGNLEFIADYYREGISPFPDRTSVGGARYLQMRANAPGDYVIQIRHVGAADVRATKVVTLQVSQP